MLELRRQAQLARFTFVEANCYEGSLAEYGPIADALGYVIRLADAVAASDLVDHYGPELARLVPELKRERHVVPARSSGNSQEDRIGLIDRVCEFLMAVAERAPFILFVNDLQWGRSSTADLLSYLSRTIAIRERSGRRVPLAIVIAYRDDEVVGRPIEKFLGSTWEGGEVREIRLATLGTSDLRELLASMLGIDSLPDEFVARVSAETGGNPFFVGEVMRTLVENGAIYLESRRRTP